MAPTSIPKTPETERPGTGKMTQKFDNLFRCLENAKFLVHPKYGDPALFFKHDDAKLKPLSIEEISELFQQYMDDVGQAKHHQPLKSMLDFNNGKKLTKCICLGLGSFAINPCVVKTQSNISLHQLAVLTTMLRILKDRHCIQEVLFQDPAFVEADRTFLQSLGYTVLETPAACEKMTTSTFLFAPFVAYFVTASALDVAFPALYIGNSPASCLVSLRRGHGFLEICPDESQREARDMFSLFRGFEDSIIDGEPLPSFDEPFGIEGTTVHWLSPDFSDSLEGEE